MEDKQIIDLYWERSEQAISATAIKYGNYCHSISYNILHNAEDAEECVNATYLAAWESIPPNRPQRLAVYLGKITRNFSLNRVKYYSAQKRGLGQTDLVLSELEDCIPASTGVEQQVEERLLVKAIEAFLYSQPPEKRNIFIRRYWAMTPIKDIARSFGMSESKIMSLLFRMRKELKKHLEKEGFTL
ncbi:MAG: sigma-70 family RNA polymerase sigma factor [Lachnospiraceae bacterium]|nr:sigma-70 family RNA polymerase sigma factor [Lachnospiraceae bacterium]